jgi:hypothetical protein
LNNGPPVALGTLPTNAPFASNDTISLVAESTWCRPLLVQLAVAAGEFLIK